MAKLPPQSDLRAEPGKDERDLLDEVKGFWTEGKKARNQHIDETAMKESIDLYRGDIALQDAEDELHFTANFIQAFVDRQVSMLTDNRPIFRVEPTKMDMERAAKAIKKIFTALWDESSMQRQLFKMVHNSAINASAGFDVSWNPMTNFLSVDLLTYNQVAVHPGVREAARFNEAEYLLVRRPVPLDLVRYRFGVRGGLVKPNVKLLDEAKQEGAGSTVETVQEFARGQKRGSADKVPHAWIYDAYVIDRQRTVDGKKDLFPGRRRIIFSDDIILRDGPTNDWHGTPSVEWFDWLVDPLHPWGISEPQNLKRMQLSFNDIMNGTVINALDINNTWVTGTVNAQDDKEWLDLKNAPRMRVLRHQRNDSLNVQVPPPYGGSQVSMARFVFTMAQMMTGVTDVTLGEHPGSLQSGQAIEGLQEASALMTRARQSRLEDFMVRVGQKIMALTLQYLDGDRVLAMTGPIPEAVNYLSLRQELLGKDKETGRAITPEQRQDILKYIRFNIVPGSSAPGSRQRRAALMMKLTELGAASPQDVLEAADFPPDVARGMIERAREDFQKNPVLQAKMNGGRNRADRQGDA